MGVLYGCVSTLLQSDDVMMFRYSEVSVPSHRGRGDEWADPWMRSKSPSARKTGSASRPSRRQSYSSGSSYSTSRSVGQPILPCECKVLLHLHTLLRTSYLIHILMVSTHCPSTVSILFSSVTFSLMYHIISIVHCYVVFSLPLLLAFLILMLKSIVHKTTLNACFTVWAYTASQLCITFMSLGIAQLVSFCIKVACRIRFVFCVFNG
jgi:hypothetical protein